MYPFYKIGTFGGDADAFISQELFEEYKVKYPYPSKGSNIDFRFRKYRANC